jgi:hypothetical protein
MFDAMIFPSVMTNGDADASHGGPGDRLIRQLQPYHIPFRIAAVNWQMRFVNSPSFAKKRLFVQFDSRRSSNEAHF